MAKIDYTSDFTGFFRDLYPVEGAYGPQPVIPPFLAAWLHAAFPLPDGNPAARNIGDFRTKKEGKSSLAGGVVLYMASRQPYSECVIVASDKDQAKDRVLRSVKYAIERGPLAAHAQVYRDAVELDNHSIIQAIPADWMGAAGGNYACVVFDELHTWIYENQRRLFDELVIPPTQPNGVRWIASYAGWEGESLLLKEWWDRALTGERVSGDFPMYYNQAASLLALIDTGSSSWRMPWMTEKYINEIRVTERPNTFRRIWLNEWVSNESQFLPEGAWEACYSPDVKPMAPQDKRYVVFGADASTSRDFTALVGCSYNTELKVSEVCYCRVWKPLPDPDRGKPTIDLAGIEGEILRMHKAGNVSAVYFDPFQLHSIAMNLRKAGVRMVELPQTSGRIEADQALYDAIIGRTLHHYGDPTLSKHVKNAVALETPRGFRLAKERTSLKIDAAVALSMAHYGSRKHSSIRRVAKSHTGFAPPENIDQRWKVNG